MGRLFSSQSSNLSVHGSLSLITSLFCTLIVSYFKGFVKGFVRFFFKSQRPNF